MNAERRGCQTTRYASRLGALPDVVEVAVLDPSPCPSMAETDRAAAADPSRENLRIHRLARKLAEGPIRAEVQAMGLGPVRWVSLPGEAFVETGLALKREGASFVVGYANGWVGYLPIRRAYDEGGYEVEVGPWSRVAPGRCGALRGGGKGSAETAWWKRRHWSRPAAE